MSACSNSGNLISCPIAQTSTNFCIRELGKVYGKCNAFNRDREELKVERIDEAVTPLLKREDRLFRTWRNIGPIEQRLKRKSLVRYICSVCIQFKFSRSTAALGVLLFNYFQGAHRIVRTQLHAVALTCLYIAAKLHEADLQNVTMRRLSKTIPPHMAYNVQMFLSVEFMALEFFQHDMLIPTVNDFVETYCIIAVEDSDVLCRELYRELNGIWPEDGNTLPILAKDRKLLAAYVRRDLQLLGSQMANVTALLLDDEPSDKFQRSVIATAILCITRLANQFQRWCGYLERATRYPHDEVIDCINEYILKNEDVRQFLNIGRSKVITDDMLESDEHILNYFFEANVYPAYVMIGGKIIEKRSLSCKSMEISPCCSKRSKSSSSGCGSNSRSGNSTRLVEDSSSNSLNISPMSISL